MLTAKCLAKNGNGKGEFQLPENVKLAVGDTYFSGKLLARLARLVAIAHELDQSNEAFFEEMLSQLADSMEKWLEKGAKTPFIYDKSWGGLVSCGCNYDDCWGSCAPKCTNDVSQPASCPALHQAGQNFGNGFYNDHHFHYGYFIYSAAVPRLPRSIRYLCRISSEGEYGMNSDWERHWRPQILTLIRDYANPSSADSKFPLARHKDWFMGFSWAGGIKFEPLGRNQESVSEAINSYYAIACYGTVIANRGDQDIKTWRTFGGVNPLLRAEEDDEDVFEDAVEEAQEAADAADAADAVQAEAESKEIVAAEDVAEPEEIVAEDTAREVASGLQQSVADGAAKTVADAMKAEAPVEASESLDKTAGELAALEAFEDDEQVEQVKRLLRSLKAPEESDATMEEDEEDAVEDVVEEAQEGMEDAEAPAETAETGDAFYLGSFFRADEEEATEEPQDGFTKFIQEWHVRPGAEVLSTYGHPTVGIMWEHVALHQTWFGGSGWAVEGIQMLPVVPVLEDFLKKEWVQNHFLQYKVSCDSDPSCSKLGWSWLVCIQQAVLSVKDAFECLHRLDDSAFSLRSPAASGNSLTNSLYWFATRTDLAPTDLKPWPKATQVITTPSPGKSASVQHLGPVAMLSGNNINAKHSMELDLVVMACG
eukprot:s892_g16.t1